MSFATLIRTGLFEVVGSFDKLNAIYTTINNIYQGNPRRPWLHCDGAW